MKNKIFFCLLVTVFFLEVLFLTGSCRSSRTFVKDQIDTLYTNIYGKGSLFEIYFRRGSEHNHPLMAVWLEDTSGNYIQTLYIAKSIAKGVFTYGDKSTGKWLPGSIRRPAALPVWSFSRGIQEEDGLMVPKQETAIPDAYTGPTPVAHFVLHARTDTILSESFYLYFEINQSWDWNKFWTNKKFPDDKEYKTSSQPALVYKALIDRNQNTSQPVFLKLIGHSHYSGKNGNIYSDINTISSAKDITESISVRLLE